MYKVLKRFSALLLMIILVLQVSTTASASAFIGTESWTNAAGQNMNAIVVNNGSKTISNIVASGRVTHYQGMETIIPAGDYRVTLSAGFNFPGEYLTQLTAAAEKVGITRVFSQMVYFRNATACLAEQPSGIYYPTTDYFCYYGTYRVEKIGATETTVVASGTIGFAPYYCSGVFTGIVKRGNID